MKHTSPRQFYAQNSAKYSAQLNKLKAQNRKNSIYRGIVFILLIAGGIYTYSVHLFLFFSVVVLLLFVFSYLIRTSSKLNKRITQTGELLNINRKEEKALEGDISVFDAGNEFIDYSHTYSYDLDLFGEGSVFQFINRTCSTIGKVKLMHLLSNQKKTKEEIINQQEAVKELSQKAKWRQTYTTVGNINLETRQLNWFSVNRKKQEVPRNEKIAHWLNEAPQLKRNIFYRAVITLLPVATILSFILFVVGVFSETLFIYLFIFNLLFIAYHLKKINQIHHNASEKIKLLKKYADLLAVIESEKFDSKKIQQLKDELRTDKLTAGKHLKHFVSDINALDNRLNMIFAIISNGFLLWDIHFSFRILAWKQKFSNVVPRWFDVIAEIDALNSIANMAYNNPAFIYPQIADDNFVLDIEETGHILLDRKASVCNSFLMNGQGSVSIITGANMAGKSTFLRTIGCNLILAKAGAPVYARKFVFSLIELHTSIRTNDSIQKSESYFYAELKRLKSIIDRLDNGVPMFVIVDEMLRGTNSKDKHYGSAAFIEQLVTKPVLAMLATHDIELGKLKDKYPGKIQNKRFEVDIDNDKLYFDYKLKDGISQNLNATFLMKQMKIIT